MKPEPSERLQALLFIRNNGQGRRSSQRIDLAKSNTASLIKMLAILLAVGGAIALFLIISNN